MLQRLSTRLILLLSIALLPIGLIAVHQTASFVGEARKLAERDILSRTVAATNAESVLVRRALGAAYALGRAALLIGPKSPECSALMKEFIEDQGLFVFAGFGGTDGTMNCLSTGVPVDVSGLDDWETFVVNPLPTVTVNRRGLSTGEQVLVVSVPIRDRDNRFVGFASVSIPLVLADTLLQLKIEDVQLALIDREGKVLSTSGAALERETFEALEIVPADLALDGRGTVVSAGDGRNGMQALAIVPLIENSLYVVGQWRDPGRAPSVLSFGDAAPVFPIVMWIIGLIVAYLAIERLVLRHLRILRRQMARASVESDTQSYAVLPDAPLELVQIANSYNNMIDRIAAEHAEVEDAYREKTLLLREVHHRVKNNLQLIASILNMQLRTITSPQAKRVLQRVQDRVMSLAAIHKSLYVDTSVERVRADRILREIVNSILNVGLAEHSGVAARIRLAPVDLDPDQAVPLALLVTEAVTNAVKYAGAAGDAQPEIGVELSENAAGEVKIIVYNSKGEHAAQPDAVEDGTGLGARLIEAFASQLGGEIEIENREDRYSIQTSFSRYGQDDAQSEAAE